MLIRTMHFPAWIWDLDGWIVAAAVLCALSCALLGNFLVVRRMSMMGDALSHAVLPGLAAAFLIAHSRDAAVMLAGAAVVGVLTALLTQLIAQHGKVDEGAAMGVVFTSLFAVGLVLIRQSADHVDLDPGCVLYGALELIPEHTVTIAALAVPHAVVTLAVMLVVNAVFVLVCYKELKITSFDPALATTLGINATLFHYLLMTLVAATTVASFEAVGSILVVAMLIVPAAAAHLLTDRLGPMIIVSLILAAASGVLGHLGAITLPRLIDKQSTNSAGMMAAVAGLLFTGALLFAPRHGVVSKVYHRAMLSWRIAAEDILGLLYRFEEKRAVEAGAGGAAMTREELRGALMSRVMTTRLALRSLMKRGQVEMAGAGYGLTALGRDAARALLRSHRLWESYLAEQLSVRPDHTHRSAEHLEHVTTAAMRARLDRETATAGVDPQGKPIPGE